MKFKLLTILILCTFALISDAKEDKLYTNQENIEEVKDSVYIASYYHDRYNGRIGANGKVFYQDSLTCAHRTLPFGTMVEVTNINNNKSIILEVTDRGPFIESREIDLSKRAAKELDFIKKGLEEVTIRIL